MTASALLRQLSLMRQIYSIEIRKVFAYRAEFWFRFFGLFAANLIVAYFLWRAIFDVRGTETIEGFTFGAMILYYLLVPLTEGISRSVDTGVISMEIYQGTLTRYLVYPVPFFIFKYASTLASATIAAVQLVAALLIYWLIFGMPADMTVTLPTLAVGILTAFLAGILNFLMLAAVEMVAFWADNVWSLNVMIRFAIQLLGGSFLPLALFPTTLQQVLHFTPFPYLVSFPILTMTGRVGPGEWVQGVAVMFAWMALVTVLNSVIWRRGNLRFTGVGI